MYNEACSEYNPKEDFHSNFATWFNLVAEERDFFKEPPLSHDEAFNSFIIMYGHYNVI